MLSIRYDCSQAIAYHNNEKSPQKSILWISLAKQRFKIFMILAASLYLDRNRFVIQVYANSMCIHHPNKKIVSHFHLLQVWSRDVIRTITSLENHIPYVIPDFMLALADKNKSYL